MWTNVKRITPQRRPEATSGNPRMDEEAVFCWWVSTLELMHIDGFIRYAWLIVDFPYS